MFLELKITNMKSWVVDWKIVSSHGNRICIAVGVFPLKLLAYQVSMVCRMQIGQDSSIDILRILLGWLYETISYLVCIFWTQIAPELMQIFTNSNFLFFHGILCDIPKKIKG